MKLTFDESFDTPAWPGPLGLPGSGRDAVLGEAFVGAVRLLDIVETAVGVSSPRQPVAARAASLVPAITSTNGFWSASAEADPLGTALTLLRWRDELGMAGWKGQPVAPRMKQLAEVTEGVLPGTPDRVAAVLGALERSAALDGIDSLITIAPVAHLPFLWGRLLRELEGKGVEMSEALLAPAAAKGDLASARATSFKPRGDGSLTLLRPHGVLAAAEEVAAWLASRKDLTGVVVVTPDNVLDAALHRFGLPTTGAAAEESLPLKVLPLVLEMAWSPPDPRRALELLLLPSGPVPPSIAARLIEALQEWPAVDSDDWRSALRDGLERIEDAERRGRVAKRIDGVFASSVARSAGYPAAEALARARLVARWAGGAASFAQAGEDWEAVTGQCKELENLITLSGLSELTPAQLRWFVEEATRSAGCESAYDEQAGLDAVATPGAVAGAADAVVWWDFTRDSAPGVRGLPLSRAEQDALSAADVHLGDPGAVAIAQAARWRRPLEQATGNLVLVCPTVGDDGEALYPHPLWDEIEARLERGGEPLSRLTPPFAAKPKTTKAKRRVPPAPVPEWKVPAKAITPRDHESPSSLGKLIGCPLGYVLEYCARMRGGGTAELPEGSTLLGSLAHAVIASLLGQPGTLPATAEKKALALFDKEAKRLAATILLPGADLDYAEIRYTVGRSASRLFELMQKAKRKPVLIEETISRKGHGITLTGQPDLVVGDPRAIIDFKWRGASYRRGSLEEGAAFQLAVYSYLAGTGRTASLPAAYFILTDQRVLALDPAAFPGCEKVDGPPLSSTWKRLGLALVAARDELARGVVRAAGIESEDELEDEDLDEGDEYDEDEDGEEGEEGEEDEDLSDTPLELPAECQWCPYGVICGKVGV